MYFEEAGLKNVNVDAPHQIIDFETDYAFTEVDKMLSELFASELGSYQYSDLILKP
jgi:hypothetical protein